MVGDERLGEGRQRGEKLLINLSRASEERKMMEALSYKYNVSTRVDII